MSEKIVQLNEEVIKSQIKELVRGSVEETLNELLEKEAESLTQAARYERSEARQGYRSGHHDRSLTTTSGGHHAGHLYPHHRRYAAHGRRQHRPRHRQSSAAGGRFRAGAGNCTGLGGKAEYDRFQALRGPQAQVRHWLHQPDQRPSF